MGPATAIVPYQGASSFPPRAREAASSRPAKAESPLQRATADANRQEAFPQRRPSAAFLAHLIATSRNLPQTRERRRAEPDTAIAAYAATVRL